MGEMHCGSAAAMQERNVEGGKLMGGFYTFKTLIENPGVERGGGAGGCARGRAAPP